MSVSASPSGIAAAVPALVVVAHDLQALALEQGDAAQKLLAEDRVGLKQTALRGRELAALLEDAVRDPDLADVVEQEAVLDALVLEQRGIEPRGELHRVALHSLGVRARVDVLRLERAGERRHCLAVGALDDRALAAFDLQQAAEVLRVQDQLLLGRAGRRAERPLVQAAGDSLDEVQELQRAERLAQERVRAARPGRRSPCRPRSR